MSIRIWHDDMRREPRGWKRARSNAEAITLLCQEPRATQISLDRDMGPGAPTGEELCFWLVEHPEHRPKRISIHSANPPGAQRMLAILRDGDIQAKILPNGGVDW